MTDARRARLCCNVAMRHATPPAASSFAGRLPATVASLLLGCVAMTAPVACSSASSPSATAAAEASKDGGDGQSTSAGGAKICKGWRTFRSSVRAEKLGTDIALADFAASLDDANYVPAHNLDGPPPHYAAGYNKLRDLTILTDGGDVMVASTCALDNLGQARRLDFALAAAAELVAGHGKGVTLAQRTAWWARPSGWYTEVAARYQRQYLADGLDLNKPMSGTIACTEAPVAAGFGLVGSADAPSTSGDVVAVESLSVDGVVVASGEKAKSKAEVALFVDFSAAVGKGELPLELDLLVADASIRDDVGTYYPFFEAVFDQSAALTVSLQGALPGQTYLSRDIDVLALPDAVTALFG